MKKSSRNFIEINQVEIAVSSDDMKKLLSSISIGNESLNNSRKK